MRLHALSITAFGPFADTVRVDFDTLAESGLFLLTGPTGAGKSSVLDAACFALYGEVPGDRSTAKRLRCDVAPAGAAPQVFLDVSFGDRRFHLTRSPAWQRPKKRGTGLTTQQAAVLVQEVRDGVPTHVTNRLDEAGHLVGDLVGMTVSQFTQVALLPQGRFQDFLRARSEERHRLLQRLFRTHRFEQVEQWLRERRSSLRRRSESQESAVAALVHRLAEAARRSLGDGADGLVELAATGDLAQWAGECEAGTQDELDTARRRLDAAVAADATAAAALDRARGLAELQDRHAAAVQALGELDHHADKIADRRAAALAARRARPVAVVHAQLLRARDRHHVATSTYQQVLASTRPYLPGEPCQLDVAHALEKARDALASARALEPRAEELALLREELAGADELLEQSSARIDELQRAAAQAPLDVASAEEECRRIAESARLLDTAREESGRLEAQREALATAAGVATALAHARQQLREAVDQHQERRQHWLELREQRLSGMAAEIASSLAVGASCPVCGSCEHPHPALPAPGAPTAAREKAARRAADDADVVRQAHDDQVRQLEQRAAVLSTEAGSRDLAEVESLLVATRQRIVSLAAVTAGEQTANDTADRARATLATTSERLARTLAEHDSLTTTRSALAERVRTHTRQLASELGGLDDVASLVAARQTAVRRLHELTVAQQDLAAAERSVHEAEGDLADVVVDAGFATAEEAVAAILPAAVLAEYAADVEAHDRAVATARATLAEASVRAAGAQPPPPLRELGDTAAAAAETRADAEAAHRSSRERRQRVSALYGQLGAALDEWEPIRHEHEVIADLASFVEGKSTDNTLQMRLSAYVLSWRLGQVVAAANERLSRMTDRRFTLEHTARRGAGESRGGLSLRVVDDWSGESRDPVTLSGGETFVVSLALALGLTDVVSQEAGGAHVGTLFVDEGFGSLDADTLDDVMDTLDNLRQGGRVVGIVSHVPELRVRVPAQLRVAKARTGSTLHMVHEIT